MAGDCRVACLQRDSNHVLRTNKPRTYIRGVSATHSKVHITDNSNDDQQNAEDFPVQHSDSSVCFPEVKLNLWDSRV